MDQILVKAIEHWSFVAPLVKPPTNAKDFDKLVLHLDQLLDTVGEDENHRLMGLVDLLSHLVAEYEEEHILKPKNSGVDVLKFLMESHGLLQSDFPEIASQGVMSEILNGKRSLNMRQIKLLAKRFKVSPSTFID